LFLNHRKVGFPAFATVAMVVWKNHRAFSNDTQKKKGTREILAKAESADRCNENNFLYLFSVSF